MTEEDTRNLTDRFKGLPNEEVKAALDRRRHAFHAAIENWRHDFNIGSVVRTANAFNAASVRIVGKRKWNRRGAMCTEKYMHEHHHPDVADLAAWAAGEDLPIIGADNIPGAVALEDADIPERCVLLFGQEGDGLSDEARDACEQIVYIRQWGSTRSINAGAAAAVVMHEWCRRHADPARGGRPTD